MILSSTFPAPEVNLSLEVFLREIRDVLGTRLVSVVLYGSIVFDDLAPGYGDLDFLAVVGDDLSDELRLKLIEARAPLRGGAYGKICWMIEGAFLPRKMLDPAAHGSALWWGTSGERRWEVNQLGWLVLQTIGDKGLVVYGEDVRGEIPEASREDLLADIGAFCASAREHGKGGGLHSIDWLLTAARELLLVREGRFSSKSEAADWGRVNAKGAWRELLPQAKQLRKSPELAESPDVKVWLASLDGPIQDAIRELEDACTPGS